MQAHHWVVLGLVLIAGYLIGAKWPTLARQVGV
jgi:hypothetical protein